ncbi:3-hydroxybutyrate oligomer hydrolase family protein [Aquimonas voraii]|nr:3-hydroxybutyrate oligomer hydrolase family protein [Aquimonas voraii]
MSMIRLTVVLACLALAACAAVPATNEALPMRLSDVRETVHRAPDDLLSAGLGLSGLQQATPPALADANAPTAAELRRRALWANWRGIADLTPGGGFAEVYGALPAVPGREFHALAWLPEARHPHRVMLQLPDAFDAGARCLVVTASSGSRGIYGAISLAGGWGLPRGCAVAYTDKGAGSGFFDLASGQGAGLSGLAEGEPEFALAASGEPLFAVKHAHSGDHPEADWGQHLRQAAEFGLHQLSRALPAQAPFTFENTRVIAVGVSNGGAAVLRAAADADDWLDAAVAIAPNVHVANHGRPAFDYGTEAGLLMPCALLDARFDATPFARTPQGAPAQWRQACELAYAAGLLAARSIDSQVAEARQRLHEGGWTDQAIAAGALSVSFELWRAVGATYASAYLRRGPTDMPCGFRVAAVDAQGQPRATTVAERALIWSDGSGIPPTAGAQLLSPTEADVPPALAGLRCLADLWDGDSADARSLRAAVAQTQAGPPRAGLPLTVLHGLDDGLIPEAFSSAAYVAQAEQAGRALRYWQLSHVQHFDGFLGAPLLAARYLPLMPYAYRALDQAWADLEAGRGPRSERVRVAAKPRGIEGAGVAALRAEHLALPAG